MNECENVRVRPTPVYYTQSSFHQPVYEIEASNPFPQMFDERRRTYPCSVQSEFDQAELPKNSRRPDKQSSVQKKPLSPIIEERKTIRKFNRYRRHRSHDRKPGHSKDHAYSKERAHRPSKQNQSKRTVRSERREHGWSSSSEYDSEGKARRPTKKSSSRCKSTREHSRNRDSSSDSENELSRRRDHRTRRKNNSFSSSDEDDSDKNASWQSDETSSPNDEAVKTERNQKQLRIKLQKFDGTSSWESWWAHFQNCAEYNQWSSRDKIAFLKGALTGNAAQILWDTDRTITSSFRKLVSVLKNRYSGERQADKYRAELQIRQRRSHETLSELHHDIRRLMALAYPKLTAEAREEIACDTSQQH